MRILVFPVVVACATAAHAQIFSAAVASACGASPVIYIPGLTCPLTIDATRRLCGFNSAGAVYAFTPAPPGRRSLAPTPAPEACVALSDFKTAGPFNTSYYK